MFTAILQTFRSLVLLRAAFGVSRGQRRTRVRLIPSLVARLALREQSRDLLGTMDDRTLQAMAWALPYTLHRFVIPDAVIPPPFRTLCIRNPISCV